MEITYTMKCDNCQSIFESKEAFPERQLCPRCLIVFKAGVKEVVEWFKKYSCREKCDPDTEAYFNSYRWVGEEDWQDQLKEWGINK